MESSNIYDIKIKTSRIATVKILFNTVTMQINLHTFPHFYRNYNLDLIQYKTKDGTGFL